MFYCFIVTAAWLVWHIGFRIRVIGRENLPKEGGFVLAPNHISAIDPVFVVIARFWGKRLLIMAKEEIRHYPVVGKLLDWLGFVIWVKRGKSDVGAVKSALKALKGQEKLLIFPEGTRVREGDVSHPHVGAVTFACRTDAPIVPVFLTRKKRFWAPLTLVFGEAYHPQFEGRRPSSDELEHLTQEMMDKCYALGGMQCPSA